MTLPTNAIEECIEYNVCDTIREDASKQLAALVARVERLEDCLEHIANACPDDEEERRLFQTYAREALEEASGA